MNQQCWDEGALRAYYDRELPPEELTEIAAHLGACAACHSRYNEIASRAARVSTLLGTLDSSLAPAFRSPAARWWKPAAAAGVLALAAAAAVAFVVFPRREAPPRPVAAPRVRVERPIQAAAPSHASKPAAPSVPHRLERAHSPRPSRAAAEDFLALDDDPIDTGVVVRVALDGSEAVQADVIFDDQGRPRAIREVNSPVVRPAKSSK